MSFGRRTVTGLQNLLKGSPLGLRCTEVPVSFYLHPIDSVITPVSSVGGLPFLRSSGAPFFLLAEAVTAIRWCIRHLVGEGRFSAPVPCPATRVVSVLEWDHVVYVQPGGIRIPCRQQALIMRERLGEKRCWCNHLERWHSVAGVCRWCAKMELRHPQFNFRPRHPFTTEMPEDLRRQAAEAVDRALRRVADHGDLEPT